MSKIVVRAEGDAVCCGCVNGLVEDLVVIKLTFLRSGITAGFVEYFRGQNCSSS